MRSKIGFRGLILAGAIAALASQSGAQASSILTFTGSDDGAATTGPFPNSFAAQTSFLAAASAFGAVDTHNLTSQSLGFQNTYTLTNGDGNITINGSSNFGAGISGISNAAGPAGSNSGFGIPGGPSNNNWLGFPGDTATFNLTSPTNSFGFFATGVQTFFGNVFQVSFNDGTLETLDIPINVNGGAEYFGFTDSVAFNTITISRPANANGDDFYGIDAISFNAPISATPLPAALPLFAGGLGAMGFVAKRRKRKNGAAIAA
jgi:hypothetical protein